MAGALARAVGMSEAEAQAVQTAALLHDIGMLAVPPHIVAKTGKLSPEELQKVRVHPRVGADIIRHVPFPLPVAPFIESHHERWDGTGYPAGLRGAGHPARRAHHRHRRSVRRADDRSAASAAKSRARGARRSCAPRPAPASIRRWSRPSSASCRRSSAQLRRDRRRRRARRERRAAQRRRPRRRPEHAPPRVLEDIALANREFYELYEMSQAMVTLSVADTMALIASRLTDLVPASCCALFLEDEGFLRCRYASGLDADLVKQLAVPLRRGLHRRRAPPARTRADAPVRSSVCRRCAARAPRACAPRSPARSSSAKRRLACCGSATRASRRSRAITRACSMRWRGRPRPCCTTPFCSSGRARRR